MKAAEEVGGRAGPGAPTSPAWASVADRLLRLSPSEAGGWRAAAIAASCVVGLLAVLVGELVIPSGASLGALTLVPVVAAAWLLQTRLAAVVVAIALVVRIAGLLHGLDPVTAGAEVAMLVMAAVGVRGASALLARWRESEVARSQQSEEMAVMAARERIAADLHSREVRAVFSATLKLQAALTMSGNDAVRERLEAAISELDELTAELRKDVFAPTPGPGGDPAHGLDRAPEPGRRRSRPGST